MANIEVDDVTPRIAYTATSGQTQFVVPFVFFEDGDLVVYVNDVLKTLTTDYTVAGEGDSEPASRIATFETGLSVNDVVVITRDIPIARTTNFPTSGPFNIASLNTQLAKLFAIQQQLEDRIARTLRLVDSDVTEAFDLPLAADRALMFLAFDAAGEPVASSGVSDVAVSAFMATVVAAANDAAARTALGITDTTSYTALSNWHFCR